MTKRTCGLLSLAALLSFAPGCQRETPTVARVEIQPRSVTLPYPQLAAVHLTWTPAAGAGGGAAGSPAQPLVFLHLLDAKGQVLRTFDHPYPQHWAEGSPVSYDATLVQSALAPPLDPGRYRLSIGLFEPGGKRWPLDGLDKPIGRLEYLAGEIEVPPVPPGPRFTFSGSWLPLEAGTDKQVVARRWLSEQAGEIRVDAIPGPGTLWFSFRIPPGDGGGDKLVPHDAGNTLAAVVRSTCGAVETGISGPGPHDVEIPIQGPAASPPGAAAPAPPASGPSPVPAPPPSGTGR